MNYVEEHINEILEHYKLKNNQVVRETLSNILKTNLYKLVDLKQSLEVHTLTDETVDIYCSTPNDYFDLIDKVDGKLCYCKQNDKIYSKNGVSDEVYKYLMENNYSPFLFEVIDGSYAVCKDITICPEFVETMKYYINNEKNILRKKEYINLTSMRINTEELNWAFMYIMETKFKNHIFINDNFDKYAKKATRLGIHLYTLVYRIESGMDADSAINKGIQERNDYNLYDCDNEPLLLKPFVVNLIKRKIRGEF